jgi:hypothetical protein
MASDAKILKAAAIILTLFGMVTVCIGGAVVFDLFGLREKEGNFVPFVVFTNFICGFIYIITAYGFWNAKRWSALLILCAFILLIVTFGGLIFHITTGGLYQFKTIDAMLFRLLFTMAFASLAYLKIYTRSN